MAVVELTKENFEQVVTSNPTVVVDYWAPWCGPCRGFAPVFERVAEANPDVVFAKVNTDDEQEIASHFQIRSIPTLMVFRDQIIVFSQPGALPQNALEQLVAMGLEQSIDVVVVEDIAVGVDPLEVGEALLERVPVVAEASREMQRRRDVVQQLLLPLDVLAVDVEAGEAGALGDRLHLARL